MSTDRLNSLKPARLVSIIPSASSLGLACLLGVSMLALGACSGLKREKQRETYDITAPREFSGLRKGRRAQILIKEPTALKAVDSDRIIVKPDRNVVTYLSGAQWTDTVPKLVQTKLVESFENAGVTRATSKPGDGLVIDYQLVIDIRQFEVFDGDAVIELSIKLLRDSNGVVRETRIFRASKAAKGIKAEDYVTAFDLAFDEIAQEIVRWVVRRT